MGIIIKQSIKGSVWSYIGTFIGFITVSYFYPKYLTPEVVGLFGLLISIAGITSQLASLGFDGVTVKFFPYFRSKEKGHNGFLFISSIVHLIGFLLFLGFYYYFKQDLIDNNIEKSPLFAEYIYLIVPITLFFMIFIFFDNYSSLLYNSVLGAFLQEFFQRVLILAVIILYVFKIISLQQLIVGYAIAVCLKGVVIVVYLWLKGEVNLTPKLNFITKDLRKEMLDVAFFQIIGGLGSMIVFSIDKIVINQMLNLSNTGVYTMAFFFGTLVSIPSRPLLRISGALIADSWAKNDIEHIKDIYYKSCINQLIIGSFLLLGLWANIDNILTILGPDYLQSKWVIFFIGIGYLFDMMTGANISVIRNSKYYRVILWFIVILVFLVVTLLYLLIPVWGITGAAIAIAIALFLNNLMRYLFLLVKFKMQPFNYKYLIVVGFFGGLYFLLLLIPQLSLILDIIIRGVIICFLSALFIIFVPVSEDIELIKNSVLKRIGF